MDKTILVVGDETDLHIVSVCSYLRDRNARIILLNPVEGTIGNISYQYAPFSILFNDGLSTVAHTEVTAVWWRLKPYTRRLPGNMDEAATAAFVSREWQMALEPLGHFLDSAFWINKRSTDHRLRSKPYQLHQAANFGFTIPQTIISNNYELIIAQSAQFDELMYKPLSYFYPTNGKILFANKMSRTQMQDSKENIVVAPGIFQCYVEKDYELRITVVNKTVFAAKIYSQENEMSKSDWRRNQFELRYEPVTLDKKFEERLISFHRSLDLVYGAYDFIVDKKGDHVFLEVNPAGQWLWLEGLPGMQISKQVAETLLEGG